MASDAETSAQIVNGDTHEEPSELLVDAPSTPQDNDDMLVTASQQTLPSTEAAASPIDAGESFKTEINDDRIPSSQVIPSSMTPPPSSQPVNGIPAQGLGFVNSQRSGMVSPPTTGLISVRRDGHDSSEYNPPAPQQVVEASPDELRSMLQACIGENAKLKMEAAHHKLQYNLLSLQADEDAKRSAVEHDMIRREVDALRLAEHSRQARRELSAASESAQAKYFQVKLLYEQALEDNEALGERLKRAKKIIQSKEDEVVKLAEERDMALNRIRENREHFHILCSPGGIFHAALTPTKSQGMSSPSQHRATPRQTPKSSQRDARRGRDHGEEPLAALLQVVSQENNSAPSTPTSAHRPAPKIPSKHTRNVQSMSSLPTTPTARSRGEAGGLLPSVDLVPQTEPPYRHSRFIPETPTPSRHQRRKSRESTISAEEDNEELARQALQSVAAASMSQASLASRSSRRREDDADVYESQASQAASEMLRRDPRESFDVASSVGSRDGTPAPAEKSAKLQAKLFAGLNKSGATPSDKRKFSGNGETRDDVARRERDALTSPTKKLRVAGGLRDPGRVGLGIQYSQEA
ncbi:hypothetical protein GQ53DRAFT_751137 [Thozetella sp. PMI_491]|nr:hypothetical protein GQ53DRAFT_751137 [Thozetella sp. PMI_491]